MGQFFDFCFFLSMSGSQVLDFYHFLGNSEQQHELPHLGVSLTKCFVSFCYFFIKYHFGGNEKLFGVRVCLCAYPLIYQHKKQKQKFVFKRITFGRYTYNYFHLSKCSFFWWYFEASIIFFVRLLLMYSMNFLFVTLSQQELMDNLCVHVKQHPFFHYGKKEIKGSSALNLIVSSLQLSPPGGVSLIYI